MTDPKVTKALLGKAREYKDEMKTHLNRVLAVSDVFYSIKDEARQKLTTKRNIDSGVIDSIDALTSFIVSSVLPRGANWATIGVDESLFQDAGGDSTALDEFNRAVDKETDTVFRYLQNSNYYTEITKSVKSAVKLGTGAFAIRENANNINPFIFQHVGVDNLFILEDNLSRPNIIFKKHADVAGDYLLDLWPSISLPSEVDPMDPEKVTTVYEIIIPVFDEKSGTTKYEYYVSDVELKGYYLEIEMEYSPITVFRLDYIEGSVWGTSPTLNNVDILEEIALYKELYIKQAQRIASPPAVFNGNRELFHSLKLDHSTINYIGDPVLDGNQAALNYLDPHSNLMPLDETIKGLREKFRQALMVDAITYNAQDGKGITATYVNFVAEQFRKRFSGIYENINMELLAPTFLNPLSILIKRGLVQITQEAIPFLKLSYVNTLSKASDSAKVEGILNYCNVVSQITQANQQAAVPLNLSAAINYIATKLDIDPALIPTEEELAQMQQQAGMPDVNAAPGVIPGQDQGAPPGPPGAPPTA